MLRFLILVRCHLTKAYPPAKTRITKPRIPPTIMPLVVIETTKDTIEQDECSLVVSLMMFLPVPRNMLKLNWTGIEVRVIDYLNTC